MRSWAPSEGRKSESGFTLLELTVVVVVISVLFLFAYQRYLDLLVDVEKAAMEQTLGTLRSAVGMKVARAIVDGDPRSLITLEGSNPVDLLAEVPKNYIGGEDDARRLGSETGIWYFDSQRGLLIYRVKNKGEFFSETEGLKEASFRLVVVYESLKSNRLAGLSLRTMGKYSWFRSSF